VCITFAEDMIGEGRGALKEFDKTDFLRARPHIGMLITLSFSVKIVSRGGNHRARLRLSQTQGTSTSVILFLIVSVQDCFLGCDAC
jgi:hypothetical protein